MRQRSLKFRQGVGRLILDNCIVTRPYQRVFLKALPDCPVKVI
jgi:Rad3-related DNA helicase